MRFRAITITMILVIFGLLVALGTAVAQQTAKQVSVGILSPLARTHPLVEEFVQELREHGWVEGQNLTFVDHPANRQYERFPALAAELVHLRVDVIFALTAPAIRAAKQATTTIPIVFETRADAVAMGFVSNLERPGENITGVTGFVSQLGGKWLELLREVMPGVNRVAVLTNPNNPNTPSVMRAIKQAAQSLGVQLHIMEVRNPQALDSAFAAIIRAGASGLIVPPDPLFFAHQQRIVALAATSQLPAIYGEKNYTGLGGLMFYGTNIQSGIRRAAVYVDKILRGAKPGELPIERPTKFELIINLKTASALDLKFPPPLLFQADEVIK